MSFKDTAKLFKDADFVIVGYINGLYRVYKDGRKIKCH